MLSDRMAAMRGGKVLQIGSPLEVYERPADLFVAEFIGKAIFLSGKLLGGNRVQIDDRIVEATPATAIAPGSAVKVMIRTENLQIQATGFEGSIEQALYLVRCGNRLFRVLELRRRGVKPHAEGAPVSLGWNPKEALVYPA